MAVRKTYSGNLLGGLYGNGIFDQRLNPQGGNKLVQTPLKKPTAFQGAMANAGSYLANKSMVDSAVALAGGPIPGNIQALIRPKATTAAPKPKAKAKAPAKAVARRVGAVAPKAPVAPPVDPLDTLRGEYDKYLTDMYGGLNVSLEDIRKQYQTRSQELGTRLGQIYDDSANVAGETANRTNEQLASFAASQGLGEALQGRDNADWQATNERLKSLNAVNRAASMATNDTIRTNYYDFLGDKIASAKGQEAMSRGTLNDMIVQAKLARQQALAAAAAARRGGGRGGRGGGGSGGFKSGVSQGTASKNDELNALFMNNPRIQAAMMADDKIASSLLRSGLTTVQPKKSSNTLLQGIYNIAARGKTYAGKPSSTSQADALAYYLAAGKSGGPVTSSKTTASQKGWF